MLTNKFSSYRLLYCPYFNIIYIPTCTKRRGDPKCPLKISTDRGLYICGSNSNFFFYSYLYSTWWIKIYRDLAGNAGLLTGIIIGFFTEYYTSDHYKPTRNLLNKSLTGAATIIIGGLSLGMASTLIPVITVVAAILAAYFLGGQGGSGLYGIGMAAVGMLSTFGITLATDAYGPVADNARGIAEMAGLDLEVRERTDALDSLGNTTAATGKGFAIGSAALTALALLAAYGNKEFYLPSVFNTTGESPEILNPCIWCTFPNEFTTRRHRFIERQLTDEFLKCSILRTIPRTKSIPFHSFEYREKYYNWKDRCSWNS